jgi:hypothetical protein
MYEVPKEWAQMTREEQEAWAAAVLKQLWHDMGGVLPDETSGH